VHGLPEVQASSRTGGTCKSEPPLVEKRLHVSKTRKMFARHSQLGHSHETRDALRLLQLVCDRDMQAAVRTRQCRGVALDANVLGMRLWGRSRSPGSTSCRPA